MGFSERVGMYGTTGHFEGFTSVDIVSKKWIQIDDQYEFVEVAIDENGVEYALYIEPESGHYVAV